MNRWHVVRSQPKGEYTARENLLAQNFETFLPECKVDDPRRPEPRPLFQGYLFVLFDRHEHQWRPINSTRGVKRLLCSTEDFPIPVQIGVIEELIERLNRMGGIFRIRSRRGPNFHKFQKLRIIEGPFTSHEGPFISTTKTGEITIELDIFGRMTKVAVPPEAAIAV